MRQQRRLDPVQRDADQSIFAQTTEAPVFLGREADGVDYLCGGCGEVVLAENIADGEIFDVVFRCARCGELSAAPPRPPSHPLTSNTAKMRRGEYPATTTFEITQGYVVVSEASADRYLQEIGQPPEEPFSINSPEAVEHLIDGLHTLVGSDFERMDKKDAARRRGGPGQESHRHPLMVRVGKLLDFAEGLRKGKATLDLATLTEVTMIVRLYQRFSRNPGWETIRRQIQNPHDFVHDVVNLAVMAFVADSNNGIGLQDNTGGKSRLADLLIAASSRGRLSAEVKAPKDLQDPALCLAPSHADKIVRKAFRDANTSSGGQLDAQNSGLLIVGALHLSEPVVAELDAAMRREFDRDKESKQHIAAGAIVSLSHQPAVVTSPYPLKSAPGSDDQGAAWHAQIYVHYVPNPWYTGPLRLTLSKGAA